MTLSIIAKWALKAPNEQPVRPSKHTVLWLFSALLAGCTTIFSNNPASQAEQVLVDLFYATDRNQDNSTSVVHQFGDQRGDLSFGYCEVAVNTFINNRTTFSDQQAWTVNESYSHTSDANLQTVYPLSYDELSQRMVQRNGSSRDKSALVYIHGYAKTFEDSAENMARFVYQINYQGIPMLYSWPSKGTATGYGADVTTLDWSSYHLQALLDRLSRESDITTIHIVAHSLGNRAMLTALTKLAEQLRSEQRPWRFGELILLAPDVDKGLFARDWAPILQKSPSRVTLYLTTEDFPLLVSKAFNQYPRLGDSRFPPLVYSGIESIDVSDAITLFKGHSYFRKDSDVLTDLHFLITQRQGADERPNLVPETTAEGVYWRLQSPITQESAKQ